MGIGVLILGYSASGKSTSMRNFGKDEMRVLNVAGKPLPFKKHLMKIDNPSYGTIYAALKCNEFNCYVIDDANYLMAFENFSKAEENGYGKFTTMAVNFEKVLSAIRNTSEDTIVYVMMHPDTDDNGRLKPKTIGKMLDNQLTIEGLFSIVLFAEADDEGYHFITRQHPHAPVKTPIGMFEEQRIDNDLKAVDTIIREYYDLPKAGKRAEKK